MIFKELAPWVMFLTLVLTASIAIKIKKVDVLCIDGLIATIGIGFGLIITELNYIYSNNYMITLGPLLTLACLLYLRYRNEILDDVKPNFNFKKETLKIIQIIYWISFLTSLISYYQAAHYFRPFIFFISISVAVASLGLEMIGTSNKSKVYVYQLISKILLLSLVLRLSAYFISPYPIGSDPWAHANFIENVFMSGKINFPHERYFSNFNEYFSKYPIMHLLASITAILGNFTIKESMSIVGAILVISTIFIYLTVKNITSNTTFALFSMLLINFSDFHIQWSVQLISMSFGIAIYTIVIYFVTVQKENNLIYKLFLILFMQLIVWTHTVSSFIMLVSLIALYVGEHTYQMIYMHKLKINDPSISITLPILFVALLIYHWIDPSYPFFEMVTRGLINSLSKEASFLGRETVSYVVDSWSSILNIIGFLILIFFGIIGSLCSISKKDANKKLISLIFIQIVLFFIFFIFPVLGIKDILPYRWPAFIYVTLVLLTGKGFIIFISSINKNKHVNIIIISLLLIIFSFFMITNSFSNVDSPIYGKSQNQELLWTESEMALFKNVNTLYDNYIISDSQTCLRPFQTYLNREKTTIFLIASGGNLNQDCMKNKLVIWRKSSLTRSVQVNGYRSPEVLLGDKFKLHMDDNFSKIYDTEDASAYIDLHSILYESIPKLKTDS